MIVLAANKLVFGKYFLILSSNLLVQKAYRIDAQCNIRRLTKYIRSFDEEFVCCL